MPRRYTCRYCQAEVPDKDHLYDHIYNSASCSNSHNTRRGSTRQRSVIRRTRSIQVSPQVDNTTSDGIQNQEVSLERHPTGDDVEATDPDQSCVICMTNKCQIASTSCGHLCCCIGCSQKLYQRDGRCPNCRGEWKNLIRIFT